jgi:hypothetical protein
MASYYAIAAVSEALCGLLADARPPDFSSAAIEVLQLADFHKERPIDEGVSIFLYRVGVSGSPRTLSSRLDLAGRRRLPPLPVDLYYLFTPWGRTAGAQQRLLGWFMRTLEDRPTMNSGFLNHYGGAQTLFEDDETVTLVPEPLVLSDLSNVWDIMKPNANLSVGYVARMVHLETLLEPVTGELVQTREFGYAKVRR